MINFGDLDLIFKVTAALECQISACYLLNRMMDLGQNLSKVSL